MSGKTIEITIDPKGNSKLRTKGLAGSSCRDASRLLERALGVVESDVPTTEMYQTASAEQQARQGSG